MNKATWNSVEGVPHVREVFPNSGNWAKAEIAWLQGQRFLSRLQLSCIQEHLESFPDIVGRQVGFTCYPYASGDRLLVHDDTDQRYATEGKRDQLHHLALGTYFREECALIGAAN